MGNEDHCSQTKGRGKEGNIAGLVYRIVLCICKRAEKDQCPHKENVLVWANPQWKPLRMDWRGSSSLWGSDLIFEAPKVLRVRCSSFERTANLFFLQARVSCLQALKRARCGNRAIHHGLFFHCSPGMSYEACKWLRSQISRYIWQISCRSEIDRPKVLKEARCCQSIWKLLFPVARARAQCGQKGPSTQVHWVSVFDRHQKFYESAARLDGLAKLSSRLNGVEGQIEPEMKRCGHTRVRCWCINASVTCDPCQN